MWTLNVTFKCFRDRSLKPPVLVPRSSESSSSVALTQASRVYPSGLAYGPHHVTILAKHNARPCNLWSLAICRAYLALYRSQSDILAMMLAASAVHQDLSFVGY